MLRDVAVLKLVNVGVKLLSLADLPNLRELHVDGFELTGIKHGSGEYLDIESFVKEATPLLRFLWAGVR